MNEFKIKMKEKIKKYSNKEYLDGYIKKEFIIDNGCADIYLKINSIDQLFDVRTTGEQIDLNNKIYEFIEAKTSMLDNDVIIKLHIVSNLLSSKEQGIVKHTIKEHYAIELYKVQKKYTKYKKKIFYLIMFGLASFFTYLFLYLKTDFAFIFEVLGFLFSFSLWEAFDSMIYTFSDIKYEREATCQNLLLSVEFHDSI